MNSIFLLLMVDMGRQHWNVAASDKPELDCPPKEYPCPGCALSQASKDRGFLKCEDYYTSGPACNIKFTKRRYFVRVLPVSPSLSSS
jgi:hypothetical protein